MAKKKVHNRTVFNTIFIFGCGALSGRGSGVAANRSRKTIQLFRWSNYNLWK